MRRRLLKGIRSKLGVNIAGMAIGENLKARGFGQAKRNSRGRIVDLDVVFRRSREANFNVSSAIVHIDLAAGVLQRDVVLRAHAEVPGSVKDFEVAWAGLHMAGELRECQIGAP